MATDRVSSTEKRSESGDVVSAHEDLVTYWQRQALSARARGDWTAERHALDQIILIERGDRPVGGASDECRHESCSGDEGPVRELGSLHVVRWRCDGCGAIVYSDAALAEVRREHAELRKLVDGQLGECVGCNYNDGPDEYCPHHGRPYNDVLAVTERIINTERADLAAARVEVTQLQARVEKIADEIDHGWDSWWARQIRAALAEPLGSTEDPPAGERPDGD